MITTVVLRVVLAALLLLASHAAVWRWSADRTEGRLVAEFQNQKITELSTTLTTMQQLATTANDASIALGKTISARVQADARTSQEIRRALSTTAHLRIDCVFDDGVMRALTTARDRANTAAASGINDPVPSADSTDGFEL
jgi:hypothetical protein